MTTLEPSRSPCRPHPCSVEHADVVRSYRELANRWAVAAEQATGGYETELVRYREDNRPPSFKDFLLGRIR